MHIVKEQMGGIPPESDVCPVCQSKQLTVKNSFSNGYWLTCDDCGLDDWVSSLESER